MDTKEATEGSAKPSTSAADNIKALSEIGKDIPFLLQSAGSAISALTNAPNTDSAGSASKESHSQQDKITVAARKEAFKKYARDFYTALYRIQEGLTAQANALEDAKLIPVEAPKPEELGKGITNGGLGGLDIGYLNSRTKDTGLVKEAELVREARVLLEKTIKKEEEEEDSEAMEE